MFVDGCIVEEMQGVTRCLHQPAKYAGNPVLSPLYPWEGRVALYGTVMRDPDDGTVVTKPFRCEGGALHVNAAARGGAISVAVLGADGVQKPGFGRADCAVIDGDLVRQRVTWRQHVRLDDLMGAAPAEDPDAWRAASPLHHVHARVPPMLLIHGTQDAVVPVTRRGPCSRRSGVPAMRPSCWRCPTATSP